MLAHERTGLRDARSDTRRPELLEALLEHALPPVELDHARIGREAGEGGLDCLLRNLLRLRLAREGGQEGVEVAAALGGGRGRGGESRQRERKTGECKTASWMGKRPTEPQLPMYALGGGEDVAAVAFGVVKTGEARFKGISREPKLLPGVVTIDKDYHARKMYRDWDALVGEWRVELEAIGRGFAAGDARVDPKRADTCKNCDQPMFCRIAEKAPFGVAGVGEGDPDE